MNKRQIKWRVHPGVTSPVCEIWVGELSVQFSCPKLLIIGQHCDHKGSLSVWERSREVEKERERKRNCRDLHVIFAPGFLQKTKEIIYCRRAACLTYSFGTRCDVGVMQLHWTAIKTIQTIKKKKKSAYNRTAHTIIPHLISEKYYAALFNSQVQGCYFSGFWVLWRFLKIRPMRINQIHLFHRKHTFRRICHSSQISPWEIVFVCPSKG